MLAHAMLAHATRLVALLMVMCVCVPAPSRSQSEPGLPSPPRLPSPPGPLAALRSQSEPARMLGGIAVPRGRLLFSLPVPVPGRVEPSVELHPRPRPCSPNATRHDNLCVRRLEGRVLRLEKALAAVCSAVLYADDVALAERSASGMGDVYFDSTLVTSRRPRYLRRSLLAVMQEHGIADIPPPTHWTIKSPDT